MKLDTLLEAIKVAIEHIADKITVNGGIFSASFGFALYGFWGHSKISLCIGCATCVLFSINIIFTHRKSIVDWYVRKGNKRWIKKNGNRIIEKQTKEAKVVMNTIYSNYPNAILLESNCPPVKELELLKIIYPAIGGVCLYDGRVPKQYYYLNTWAKDIIDDNKKKKRTTKK